VVRKDVQRDFAILAFEEVIQPFFSLIPILHAGTPEIGEGVKLESMARKPQRSISSWGSRSLLPSVVGSAKMRRRHQAPQRFKRHMQRALSMF
jgi:hypothetical protein